MNYEKLLIGVVLVVIAFYVIPNLIVPWFERRRR